MVAGEQCTEIGDYLARLEALTTEPPAPHGAPARPSRPAVIPEPYGQAGRVLMDLHEALPRLEASLRLAVTGSLGHRRGGSAGNTDQARLMIGKLATQLDERNAARLTRLLGRWIGAAQAVHGIDEARRWRHLPREAGEALPPACRFCGGYYLLADVDAQIVVCSVPGCQDSNGNPPVAAYGIVAGKPTLTWADGTVQTAPDLGGS